MPAHWVQWRGISVDGRRGGWRRALRRALDPTLGVRRSVMARCRFGFGLGCRRLPLGLLRRSHVLRRYSRRARLITIDVVRARAVMAASSEQGHSGRKASDYRYFSEIAFHCYCVPPVERIERLSPMPWKPNERHEMPAAHLALTCGVPTAEGHPTCWYRRLRRGCCRRRYRFATAAWPSRGRRRTQSS